MKKMHAAALLVLAAGFGLTMSMSADAQMTPKPVLTIIPTFNCSVNINNTGASVHISKANAAAVDPTKDVVATIHAPSGKVYTSVCGSVFSNPAVGTAVNASFTNPPTKEKDWIYTCSAQVTTQSFTC